MTIGRAAESASSLALRSSRLIRGTGTVAILSTPDAECQATAIRRAQYEMCNPHNVLCTTPARLAVPLRSRYVPATD